jgi:putative ATPase
MEDLWAAERAERRGAAAPLAARMRPESLDDVVGQQHLLGEGASFRSVVESGRPVSMILWGPPGSGKTTLARLIAGAAGAAFAALSASTHGVRDVRQVLAEAESRLGEHGSRTVLFLDEIHRFSKAQQDALLPAVEDGIVVLVGATTENPFFEVNSPLLSRCTLYRLEALTPPDVEVLLTRAVADALGGRAIDPEATRLLAERVGGDARLALNALEVADAISGGEPVSVPAIEEALQRRIIRYDKKGDQHYDVISAFIKSIRGSDPDAALYWLHTMLEAGEDPEFIARRMVVLASEDVGLADQGALGVAVDAARALAYVGLPEAAYALSHAAVYLAAAPKSNSITRAMAAAREAVHDTASAQVPIHLRSQAPEGAYSYPHDYPGGIVDQQYLPDELAGTRFYDPIRRGDESRIAERRGDVAAVDE